MKQGECCYFVLVDVKRNIIVQFKEKRFYTNVMLCVLNVK